jgi:peroxiredoxin
MWQTLYDEGVERLVGRGFVPVKKTMSYNKETGQYETKEENLNLDTPEGRALYEEYRILRTRIYSREPEYLRRNPSIVSYARLYSNINSGLRWGDADQYIDIYNEAGYAEKYPDSPYTRELANLPGAVGNIKVGGKYIDFTLPDLDGNSVTLSEYIAGKVALVNLWMTWCGPCRKHAIETIPVWEEFRDRGFTVIGASGDSDLESIKEVAAKDGHQWPTLVDLKGAAGLWSKYGISGSGGSTYLVDRDGTILAVNPNVERIRKILVEKL